MNPHHFLDQIFLDLDVETEAGRRHHEVATFLDEGQTQTTQQGGNGLGTERHTQHLVHPGRAQTHRLTLGQCGHRFRHGTGLATADIENQAGSPLQGTDGTGEIDAPLEAVGGIAGEAVTAGLPGNGKRSEKGRLQEQVGGFQGDAAFATHDAGQS